MADAVKQMPEHVGAAYKAAVDNIPFLKRQQWLATNYALILYAAIFLISAHYFSRTDVARNWLGLLTVATLFVHWYMLNTFQRAIARFRERLRWIYSTYFSEGGACRIRCAAGTATTLVSAGGLRWPHGSVIRRGSPDCNLFVVRPLTSPPGLDNRAMASRRIGPRLSLGARQNG
jgi:hypothetical protein